MSSLTDSASDDRTGSAPSDGGRDPPSLLGRTLFAGVLGFTAVENFRGMEGQIGYAEANGVPYADKLVPFSSGMLAAGSLGLLLWRLPAAAAGAVAAFLVGVTPTMHDFWNEDDEQQQQAQMYQFVKNVAILGAAITFLGRALDR